MARRGITAALVGALAALLAAGLGVAPPVRAAGGRVREKDVDLDETLRLAAILSDHGFEVALTRQDDTFVPLRTRAASGAGADLFLSIHNNAGPPADHGTEIYSQVNNARGADTARALLASITARAGTTRRFAVARVGAHGDYYAVLRGNPAVALIVEGAYISNRAGARRLADGRFRQLLAEGIADGVEDEFAALPRPQAGPGPPPRTTTDVLLDTPAQLVATRVGPAQAVLRWLPVDRATGYRLWRDGMLLGDVGASSRPAALDPVSGAGVHRYEVRAVLQAGDEDVQQSASAVAELVIPWRVVLDAGHGGRDSGAVGRL